MRGRTLTAVGAATALAATAVVGISGAAAAKPKPAKTVTGADGTVESYDTLLFAMEISSGSSFRIADMVSTLEVR